MRIREDDFEGEEIRRPKDKQADSSEHKPNGKGGEPDNDVPPVLHGFNPDEWASDPEPEKRKWIVPDYILAETTTMLSGDGGTGKSYLAHQLTAARALGRE